MTADSDSVWPALRLEEWQATRDTLTLWTQVVGKIRIAHTPLINHWWNAPLYLTARGLTTSLIPYGPGRSFTIDFDFRSHVLDVMVTDGTSRTLSLMSFGTVADFHDRLMKAMDELDLHTGIWPVPVELEGAIP